MKKKTCFYFLIIACVMLTVFAQRKASVYADGSKPEAVSGVSGRVRLNVTGKYEDGGLPGKVLKAKAIYDDEYFYYTESAAYEAGEYEQGELARLSMLASATAYKGKYAKKLLTDCGFSNVKYIKAELTEEDNDCVSFAMGMKTVGEDAIVAILIRGTGSDYEWVSNFNLGAGEVHSGFSNAEQELNKRLNKYLRQHPVKGNIRFWVTGHSRGAAVGNLLSKRLTDRYGQDRVYAYTFATPRVAVTSTSVGYENIFNYLNPGDLVTEVAPEIWNYGRFGIDKTLTADTKAAMEKAFKKKTGQSYEGFTDGEKQALLNMLLLTVGSDQDAYQALQILAYYILSKMNGDDAFNHKFVHAHCPTSYICWLNAMY